MIHLVTGYAGYEHIKSADEGAFNAAFFGDGQYVLESGNQLEASVVDNNTVRILDGDLLMYGRHIRIEPDTYEDLNIETGTAGVNRTDLIVMVFERNANDGTEFSRLQVIKGAESTLEGDIPEYTDGNILEGATLNQMPLYTVTISGVVLEKLTPVFKTIPTYKTLAEQYAAQFQKACETYLGALNILDTMEEVNANTLANQLAGALAVKELYGNVATKEEANKKLPSWNGGKVYRRSTYAMTDATWKKVFSISEKTTGASTTFCGCLVKGKLYYHSSNYNSGHVREYPFTVCFDFLNATTVIDMARLILPPTFDLDIIRVVKVDTNSYEIQIKQKEYYKKTTIEFSVAPTLSESGVWEVFTDSLVNATNKNVVANYQNFNVMTEQNYCLPDGSNANGTWGINISGSATADENGNVIADTYCTKADATAMSNPFANYTTDIFNIDFADGDGVKNRPCLFDENTKNIPEVFFSGARRVIFNGTEDIKIILEGTTVDNIPVMAIASYDGSVWSEWQSPVMQTL